AFLGSVASPALFALRRSLWPLRINDPPDLPGRSPYEPQPTRPIVGLVSLLRPPFVITWNRSFRNINRMCIRYAFRPRVSSRLTLSGRTFLRKPYAYGGEDSHFPYRYLCRQGHFSTLHQSSRSDFAALRTLL